MPTQPDAASTGPETPEVRPEIPQPISNAVKEWFVKLDNLTQRKNALWEYREANKTLFPSRFNVTDPRRGQTPMELQSGRDKRRVQTPYIFRGSLQITAMSVPEDLDFMWEAKEQAEPPADPNMPKPATSHNPMDVAFGKTLRIVERDLLDEAGFVPKLRAFVQDSSLYPLAVIKATFRREYQSASLNPNPGDKDETDGVARLQSLVSQFARKEFTENDPKISEMKSLLTSLKDKARISRWWGIDLQLIPLDSFGVSEECTDLVNIYDAPYMFHDALIMGEELLANNPYREGEDGETFGILPEELSKAVPWDTSNNSTDPNAKNRSSRNKQLTSPSATAMGATSATGAAGTDPKKRQYLVREIWCKRDRTVYTVIRGLDHFVDRHTPQKTPQKWYPFTLLAPNRVPTENYAASDLELKRDIQARIHRKRTDEEKARNLSLPRGIYNRLAGTDEKEMVKLQDILPGQLRGINFGTAQTKIDDMVQWFKYEYNPLSFDTTKDEQDMDQMGALPVQALGATGSANFATEVSVASAGATIATNFRKSIIQQAIESLLTDVAEIILQEVTVEEAQKIAGPFAVWPEIYDEAEAAQMVEEAKIRAAEAVAPQVIQQIAMMAQQTGAPPDAQSMGQALEQAAAPLWQSEMMQKYGGVEPMTRESMFRRLKCKVKSSFNSRMDKQQNLAMFAQLAEALMQIGQACAGGGQPFNMRPIIQAHASLLGDTSVVDEAFPAISPQAIAQHLAAGMLAASAPPEQGAETQNGQGAEGAGVDPAGQAQNALQSAPAPMG